MPDNSTPTQSVTTSSANDRLMLLVQEIANEQITALVASGHLFDAEALAKRDAATATTLARVEADRESIIRAVTQMLSLFKEVVPTLRGYSAMIDTLTRYTPSDVAIDTLTQRVAEGRPLSHMEAVDLLKNILQVELPSFAAHAPHLDV